jgi:NAD-dependent SIR2 family protein deacetylase
MLALSVQALVELARGRRILALTGAGISTESGIPDYRGAGRSPRPMLQDSAFRRDPETRRRYWARSAVGFERFFASAPNTGHLALAELERAGVVTGVITQNVDGLHHAAGSRRVIELHGALKRVVCLDCSAIEARNELQQRLLELNPDFDARDAVTLPDGDAELPPERIARFRVAACTQCGGILKPDVVLFGGSVPKATVAEAMTLFEGAELCLVVGSSLAVFSGYRFVRHALERELPICIVNLGPTRADAKASLRIEARAGELLPELARQLLDREHHPHLPG